jgi:hypothetical protein
MEPNQATSLFAKYPTITRDNVKLAVIGLNVSGDPALFDAIKTKLAGEGWPSSVLPTRAGAVVLSIGTEHKTLQEVIVLAERFVRHEFGAVETEPMVLPVPEGGK